jgi:hypothetical protein
VTLEQHSLPRSASGLARRGAPNFGPIATSDTSTLSANTRQPKDQCGKFREGADFFSAANVTWPQQDHGHETTFRRPSLPCAVHRAVKRAGCRREMAAAVTTTRAKGREQITIAAGNTCAGAAGRAGDNIERRAGSLGTRGTDTAFLPEQRRPHRASIDAAQFTARRFPYAGHMRSGVARCLQGVKCHRDG